MYTQCPDCRAAFQVTAGVLQQASGQVQCGGCGHAFNALERLSEEPPDSQNETATSDEENKALLESLDEITGAHDIRIEDTGVEWRVLEEERYDDNTPLPGSLLDDEEDPPSDPPETPRRRAEDMVEPRSPEFDERQVDLALGEPEDWTDLLEEVGSDPDVDDLPGRDTAIDDSLADTDITDLNEDDDLASDLDTQTDLRLLETEPDFTDDLELTSEEPIVADELVLEDELVLVEDDELPGDDDAPTLEDLTTERLIDQELLRLPDEEHVFSATAAEARLLRNPPPHVETIIMEGEFVRTSLDSDAELDDAGSSAAPDDPEAAPARNDDPVRPADSPFLEDTYDPTHRADAEPRRSEVPRYALVSGAVALALLLTVQVLHAYRETLATYGIFDQTVGSVYRLLGAPITPNWDVNSWQFEAPNGSTDASGRVLTISTRIANQSNEALPYPLLHVAVTDLYEEIVGERLLEPEQYLAGRIGRGSVSPGDKFTASVTIAPVSQEASGFKLNVCYRQNSDQVRCADGAFKD